MSDLDESAAEGGLDESQHFGEGDGAGLISSDAELEAAAMEAYEQHKRRQEADAADADEEEQERMPADRAAAGGDAGFSSDDDGGMRGHGRADQSFDGHSADEHEAAAEFDADPSSIQAPTGASAAAAEAAARLAALMAEDDGTEELGSDGEDGDDVRTARKREIAALEAQLARASARQSQRSGRADRQEEKEPTRSSQPASQKASYRSGQPGTDRSQSQAADVEGLEDELAGLDDDGTYGDDGSEFNGDSDGGSDYDPDATAHGRDAEEEVRTMEDVARAKEEREHLIEVNKIRQRQIAMILEREKAINKGPNSRGGLHSSEADKLGSDSATAAAAAHPEQIRAEYIKNLENLNLLWDELESKREEAEDKIDRLTAKLDLADVKASELSDSFKSFKREIAKEARFSRTGKPIKLKRILAFESAEEAADRDVARVRLRHINLLNELHTLEQSIRAKEKLAEGLHLIDFEQLKIENQTLNEKIEERNDELHKLKKKTTTTVQVLTHIKEKLQCVREENELAQEELQSLNDSVSDLRDSLTKLKHSRDESRFENQALKQKQGFIGSDLLVSDFENRKGDIEILRNEVDALKARWRSLNQLANKAVGMERTQARGGDNAHTQQRQAHYATVKFGGTPAGAGRR